MATFTATILNSMTVLGGGPTEKWGEMIWGEDNWGVTDPPFRAIGHIVEGGLSFSIGFVKGAFKIVSESQSISDTISKKPAHTISETLQFDTDSVSMVRGLGGYDYVFTGDTTNGNDQVESTYTKVSDNSDTYTTFTTNSATWSSV